MSDNDGAARNRDDQFENLAAELTFAIYPIALRHGMAGSWIKVELGLWRALAETVKKWAREWPPAGSSDEFEVWRERFLMNLTESAFGIAVKHGIKGSLLEVELCLYRALRLVIGREALRLQITKGRRS
ncbi:MAG TPA: hypothetical protein VG055_33100 [Planctomycetaceae bacterium]|jgi:hypothetical protein|nr:hypothetical protein [Planctomycetaceae bacterium]